MALIAKLKEAEKKLRSSEARAKVTNNLLYNATNLIKNYQFFKDLGKGLSG